MSDAIDGVMYCRPYVGPQSAQWIITLPGRIPQDEKQQAIPLGYKVQITCSTFTYIGEVEQDQNGGPVLAVYRDSEQLQPVCRVPCVKPETSSQTSFFAVAASAIEKDCSVRKPGSHHKLSGPGVWALGGPQRVWRQYLNAQFQPQDRNCTILDFYSAANAYVSDVGRQLYSQGWFVAMSDSGAAVTIGGSVPCGSYTAAAPA